MPLVRVEVRNEYGLGAPEMYREGTRKSPRDSSRSRRGWPRRSPTFAAEVFHDLQEEVAITSSRSHKLTSRVQRIEAALSPLEKAVLAQRTHLHFAYAAVFTRKGDDRFDPGGPGSCLKRYSDPTFFKRASMSSGEAGTPKVSKANQGYKIKIRFEWTFIFGLEKWAGRIEETMSDDAVNIEKPDGQICDEALPTLDLVLSILITLKVKQIILQMHLIALTQSPKLILTASQSQKQMNTPSWRTKQLRMDYLK
ncbi:UNVERIFIED_CONTAM: protein SCAR1 [Sesamum radiatum]|uniref:Protein SCAR1 n=1 Tax=Sesamum radiatum TaxID=300843 RepID=A0AAW2KI62_SESRA